VVASKAHWSRLILTSILIFVFIFNLFINFDAQVTGNEPAITIKEVLISTFFWLIVGLVWFKSTRFVPLFRLIIVGGLLIRPLSVFLQTPSSLRDQYHFLFTANELAAPAAGMIPGVNFISWYTNLLGFPVAPMLRLASDHSVMVILVWLLFLEAICLSIPTLIAYKIAGKHSAILSLMLMISLMTARPSANSYFQAFPIRTLFPCLLLALVVLSIQNTNSFRLRNSIIVGLLAGLALLNNLESGLSSLLALLFTILLLYQDKLVLVKVGISILMGILLTVGAYSGIVLATGHSVKFSYFVIPVRIVSVGGFFQQPMAVAGFHNVYVIFFVTGMVTSIFLSFRAQKLQSVVVKRVSALMSFSSCWGLIGMIYFSGRSFTSTLLLGSNYPLGLLAVSVIIWIFVDKQFVLHVLKNKLQSLRMLAMIFSLLFFYIATIVLSRMDSVHVLRQAGTVWDEEALRVLSLKESDGQIETVRQLESKSDSEVGQILPLSNILELSTGVEAVLVVSHPAYLSMFWDFQSIQCQYLRDLKKDLVIEERVVSTERFGFVNHENLNGSLVNLPICNEILNLVDTDTFVSIAGSTETKIAVRVIKVDTIE